MRIQSHQLFIVWVVKYILSRERKQTPFSVIRNRTEQMGKRNKEEPVYTRETRLEQTKRRNTGEQGKRETAMRIRQCFQDNTQRKRKPECSRQQ